MSTKILENATKLLLTRRGYFQEIVRIMWTKVRANQGMPLQTQLLKGDCVAGSTGLEPAASGVTGRRSNQTELRPPESRQMVGDTRIELVTYGL